MSTRPGLTSRSTAAWLSGPALALWLAEHAPYCEASQKHLDQGTVEQAYWHYGYVCAIRDILAIVDAESTE